MGGNELFQTVKTPATVDAWSRVLALQTELFSRRELHVLDRMGLFQTRGPLLDLGCGEGSFTEVVCKHYPALPVVAVDANASLLQLFQARRQGVYDGQVKLVQWHAGKMPMPVELQRCRAALLRLVLQHVEHPVALLSVVKDVLGPGGQIGIIEEDDGFFQIEPELPAFRRVIALWKAYVDEHTGERYMGRRIPRLAEEAGLRVQSLDVVVHTNIDVGVERLMEYFCATVELIAASSPHILPEGEARTLRKALDAFAVASGRRCFVTYPQVIALLGVPAE